MDGVKTLRKASRRILAQQKSAEDKESGRTSQEHHEEAI